MRRSLKGFSLILALAVALAGCDAIDEAINEGTGGTDTSSNSGGGGGATDALAGSQVNYTFSCGSYGGSHTIQISEGPCKSSQQSYAKAMSCNDVGASGGAACRAFYNCAVNNSSGDYAATYQQYLSGCAAYQ